MSYYYRPPAPWRRTAMTPHGGIYLHPSGLHVVPRVRTYTYRAGWTLLDMPADGIVGPEIIHAQTLRDLLTCVDHAWNAPAAPVGDQ